ncbi:matrixin family metalloprotease [Nocardioides panacisoli]|uniref:matrixin family metalloprotease n=1 Tax=Nocardioides panacisoli TaxID=627624 RepID=UPI001C62ACB0|nr:matrixin family metalloprotease [Nocardioides panacisoli]QYJ05249.1 matrixin family metalloprotease [Nocardioides panacisoli]
MSGPAVAAGCQLPAGDLTIGDLPEGASAVDCDAIGRDVRAGGLELEIPEPGMRVMLEHVYPSGAVILEIAVDEEGIVSYETESMLDGAVEEDEASVSASASGPSECRQDNWNIRNERHNNRWTWYIGDGSYPAALGYSAFRQIAQQTIGRIKSAHNDCGFSDKISQLQTTFGGKTSYESDFKIENGVSKCASRDGRSTLDAGNLDKSGNPPLAAECTWTTNSGSRRDIVESDVRFNIRDFDFTTTPWNCSGKWDVRSVLMHEFGHSVGLGHVSESRYPRMTMSPGIAKCSGSARTLGKGDIHGLQLLYCLNQNCHRIS